MGDFKALADGDADFLTSRHAEHVIRHGNPQRTAFHQIRLEQAMGQDHAGGPTVDRNGNTVRSAFQRDETSRRVFADLERQAAE